MTSPAAEVSRCQTSRQCQTEGPLMAWLGLLATVTSGGLTWWALGRLVGAW